MSCIPRGQLTRKHEGQHNSYFAKFSKRERASKTVNAHKSVVPVCRQDTTRRAAGRRDMCSVRPDETDKKLQGDEGVLLLCRKKSVRCTSCAPKVWEAPMFLGCRSEAGVSETLLCTAIVLLRRPFMLSSGCCACIDEGAHHALPWKSWERRWHVWQGGFSTNHSVYAKKIVGPYFRVLIM